MFLNIFYIFQSASEEFFRILPKKKNNKQFSFIIYIYIYIHIRPIENPKFVQFFYPMFFNHFL